VSAHLAGAYNATLLVMVIVMKGGGRAPSTLTSRAHFTLMTESTPESSGYYSVYSMFYTNIPQSSQVRHTENHILIICIEVFPGGVAVRMVKK
jgi:hypothetical protein